jgi:hypothetical protein
MTTTVRRVIIDRTIESHQEEAIIPIILSWINLESSNQITGNYSKLSD